MMQHTFFRRLMYYLIGLCLGIILVFFFYGNKGCSWLPENKVKDTIKKKFVISLCNKVKSSDFNKLLENSEVVFNQSDKNSSNKSYQFKLNQTQNDLDLFYITYHAESYFAVLHEKKDEVKSIQKDTILKIISVPEEADGLINFDDTKKMQVIFKKFNFTTKTYRNTLLDKGFMGFNYLKPNNQNALITVFNRSDTLQIHLKWRDLVLIPDHIKY